MRDSAETVRLRGLYHDWCSAHLAEYFLQLSPEDVYALAEEASGAPVDDRLFSRTAAEANRPAAVLAFASRLSVDSSPSYRELVGQVADLLSARVRLPSFDEWRAAYEVDPGRFEDDLMGLSKE